MIKRYCFLFLFFHVAFSVFTQDPKTKKNTEPVFAINKKPVSTEEFAYLYRKNHQNRKDEFTREKIEEYLDLFINFKLKVTEAQHRGIDTTAVFKKEFNTYRDELRKPYLPDTKLIDSMVALTYERMKEEINASHILVAVNQNATSEDEAKAYQKIMDIREKAMKSPDFGVLAQQVSDDPSSKVNGGNLGYFTALQMVYPFESAAYQTRKGEITMPVRTQFGYHILKINDRRPSSGEVEVAHILIRTGENKDNAQSKNLIFDIYDQLQKGVAWDELCKQHSEDPSSKDNGGLLRPFGVGAMPSVPEFERAAFELQKPGEYSDPFQTQFGWHIVKLQRKIPLPAFEQVAPGLKNRVSRDERIQISKQHVYNKLKANHGFQMFEDVKSKVISLADSTILTGQWKTPVYPDSEKEVLFKLSNKAYPVKEFVEFAVQNQKRTNVPPAKAMEQLIDAFVESMLLQAVEEKIMSASPEYKWLLNEYYEGIMLFDIMEKEIWTKASADSLGQQEFYKKNAAKYKAGERVKATIYSSTTREYIEKIKGLLNENDSTKIQNEAELMKVRVEKGSFEKEDRVVLTKMPWSRGIFTAENNGLHYVVHVKSILPPGPKTFEEARPDVISDYQNHLEKNWVEALKKTYPVKISKKGKEAVIKELMSANTL